MLQRLNIKHHSSTPPKHRRERRHFIAAWLRSPLKMGACLPSSRSLARAMARQVDIMRDGTIVELGAGTGVVTQALVEAGIAKNKLLVIEREKKLYELLGSAFPDLQLLCADAMELGEVLEKSGVRQVNAIVSSLPFLMMPTHVRHKIEEQMANSIGDEGIIIQFTYGHKSPISSSELKRYGLIGKRVKLVLANVPPAHVWVYKRG
jgi:phosphatidylethanolamine/phosphatidyl-N-methylethanolamine N-methyltransferase